MQTDLVKTLQMKSESDSSGINWKLSAERRQQLRDPSANFKT